MWNIMSCREKGTIEGEGLADGTSSASRWALLREIASAAEFSMPGMWAAV